jgi:hypothetical protein
MVTFLTTSSDAVGMKDCSTASMSTAWILSQSRLTAARRDVGAPLGISSSIMTAAVVSSSISMSSSVSSSDSSEEEATPIPRAGSYSISSFSDSSFSEFDDTSDPDPSSSSSPR